MVHDCWTCLYAAEYMFPRNFWKQPTICSAQILRLSFLFCRQRRIVLCSVRSRFDLWCNMFLPLLSLTGVPYNPSSLRDRSLSSCSIGQKPVMKAGALMHPFIVMLKGDNVCVVRLYLLHCSGLPIAVVTFLVCIISKDIW